MSEALTTLVGKNLRRLRLQRGLSLERLAHTSGVSRAMISHVELGQSTPTIMVLDKLATGLALSAPLLLKILLTPEQPSFFASREELL